MWGYPLLLSVVYRAAGFDRADFSSVIWYKLPSLLSLALLGPALVLWFRRRFPLPVSALAALLFCLSSEFISAMNIMYADLVFLFLCVLVLLLMECLLANLESARMGALLGVLYGLSMFFTHETRLNGRYICVAALLGHAFALLRRQAPLRRNNLWLHLLPYVIVACLSLVGECLLAPATPNVSNVTGQYIARQAAYYADMVLAYLGGAVGERLPWFKYAVAAVCLAGIAANGGRENLHFTLLLAGTLVVVILMRHRQGLRYLYNVLPLLVMYLIHGCAFIAKGLLRLLRRVSARAADLGRRALVMAAWAAGVGIVAMVCTAWSYTSATNFSRRDERRMDDVYHAQAIEMYRYIQDSTPEDSVISFWKPRALFLNTRRLSIRADYNGHDVREADYHLDLKFVNRAEKAVDFTNVRLKLVKENDLMALYKVTPLGE